MVMLLQLFEYVYLSLILAVALFIVAAPIICDDMWVLLLAKQPLFTRIEKRYFSNLQADPR